MGSSSTSWISESNTHAGTSKVYASSTWDAYVSTDGLKIQGAEGNSGILELWADEGDDNADKWKWQVADGGSMTWQSYTGGSYATKLTLGTDGELTAAGNLNVTGINVFAGAAPTLKFQEDGQTGNEALIRVDATKMQIFSGRTSTSHNDLEFRTGDNDNSSSIRTTIGGSDGTLTHLAPITVGVDDAGHDVKYWGNTASNYMLWDTSADQLVLQGATEMMLISATGDADSGPQLFIRGNVGGAHSPGIATLVEIESNSNNRAKGISFTNADDNQEWFIGVPYLSDSPDRFQIGYHDNSSALPWYAAQNLFTIEGSTGDVGIGTTSPAYKIDVYDNTASGYVARFLNDGDNANRHGIVIQAGDDGGATGEMTTYLNCWDGDGGNIGSLTHDTSGNFVINATSDSRLKENIVDTQLDGLSLCNQIKVREFNWKNYKGGLKNRAGFIAQEVQPIFPEAASGTDGAMKDKVTIDDSGNEVTESVIDPMMISTGSFIPIIMKAIQQLSAKVTTLENA